MSSGEPTEGLGRAGPARPPTPTSGPPSRRCGPPRWPSSRASRGSATSSAWCWRPPGTAAAVADHVLLSGPPGLGKTTLAMIIAGEMGAPLRISSGPAITHAGDLAAILSGLTEGEVFFLDEIHRMSRPAEEMLYLAMEDFRVDVVVGKGPGRHRDPAGDPALHPGGGDHPRRPAAGPAARPVRLHRPARLLRHARPRAHRAPLGRAASSARLDRPGAAEIARRSRGTPRIANRLLRRVRDYAQVRADGRITADLARAALELYEVDELGLDRLDRAVLARHVHAGSAAGPSGCRPWPSRSGRSGRPSRRSPSRSWSGRAS